ncbi:MAG TPA: hypothetical protein VLJ17_17175 [Xanthobacteraceae bacterium]|nr:hypothetical protein [Xanthobacteraceae bacterium]
MPIYFVVENLDKSRGHYRAGTGKILQLIREVYVDADDDIDAPVLKHAVRIARYLYPKAYLSRQAPSHGRPRAMAACC